MSSDAQFFLAMLRGLLLVVGVVLVLYTVLLIYGGTLTGFVGVPSVLAQIFCLKVLWQN